MRKKVLVITSILPIDILSDKRNENNILLVTEDELKKRISHLEFEYIFIIPFVPYFLKFFSKKWNEYYEFRKYRYYNVSNRNILVLPCFILPKKIAAREFLIKLSMFIFKRRLKEFITEVKPTIIHAHNIDNNATIARILSYNHSIPYLVTIREKEFVDIIIEKNLEKAHKVIGITSYDVEYVKSKMNIDFSSVIIPHGIDIVKRLCASKNNVNGGSVFKIVTVSRLLDWKNIDLIIVALSKVSFNFEYNIYGIGPEFDKISGMIDFYNLKDKVFLNGQVENEKVLNIISENDLFVLLSFPETFGRVFIESLSVGTPFIANKDIAISSYFDENEGGIFIEPSELVNTLEFYYTNKNVLENNRINGYEKVKSFSWDNVSLMFNEVYN